MNALGFFLTLAVPLASFAQVSPAWIDAPPIAPTVRIFVHRVDRASSLSIQAHRVSDKRIEKIFTQLKEARASVLTSLLPAECFDLERTDLTSHQTWCRNSKGEVRAFIEIGEVRVKPAEKLAIQLQALGELK